MGTTQTRYPVEVRERAVRRVFDSNGQHDSQWGAIAAIAPKIVEQPLFEPDTVA